MESEDLGFVYTVRRGGEVEIRHHGRLAATLRGDDAAEFLGRLAATLRGDDAAEFLTEAQTSADLQQRMARVTGNYKRGNERQAANHPRNRR